MDTLLLSVVLIGTMTVTSYRSVPEQTDSTPFITASGQHVHSSGVAVSRDMLTRWGGTLNYGEILCIDGYGCKIINDTMHPRHTKHVDIWVKTYKEEKEIGTRTKKVWVISVNRAGNLK